MASHSRFPGAMLFALSLFPQPHGEFTAVFNGLPPLPAPVVEASKPGMRGWCERMLRSAVDLARPREWRPARDEAQAIDLLDRYARRLAAIYPAAIRDVVLDDYFNHRSVEVAGRAMRHHGEYTIGASAPRILIQSTILERSTIYLRIMLIHEAIVHKGQHLSLQSVLGEARARAQTNTFYRVSELTARLVEWELSQLVPHAVMAEDLERLAMTDEELHVELDLWRDTATLSAETHLSEVYGLYFMRNDKAVTDLEKCSTLVRLGIERQWSSFGMRPLAEIDAILARWRSQLP